LRSGHPIGEGPQIEVASGICGKKSGTVSSVVIMDVNVGFGRVSELVAKNKRHDGGFGVADESDDLVVEGNIGHTRRANISRGAVDEFEDARRIVCHKDADGGSVESTGNVEGTILGVRDKASVESGREIGVWLRWRPRRSVVEEVGEGAVGHGATKLPLTERELTDQDSLTKNYVFLSRSEESEHMK
jgi:hypothetical protein